MKITVLSLLKINKYKYIANLNKIKLNIFTFLKKTSYKTHHFI